MTIEQLLEILMWSPIHRKWSLEGIVRCFWPPIILGQYLCHLKDGHVVSLLTWANLTEEAAAGYISGKRLLQPDDWNAGTQLWFIDMIAPNRANALVREAEAKLAPRVGHALRVTKDGCRRVHRFVPSRHPMEIAA